MKRITSHKSTQHTHFKPFVTSTWQPATRAGDFCADSHAGKLDLASVVEMDGEESGGAPAKKKIFV